MLTIDHVHLRAADFARSRVFYRAVLEALGCEDIAEGDDWLECGAFYLDAAQGRESHVHLCFAATDEAQVARFHAAGLEVGGCDNGAPGLRDYHRGYYAAFLLDPDGNNIEAKADLRRSQGFSPR